MCKIVFLLQIICYSQAQKDEDYFCFNLYFIEICQHLDQILILLHLILPHFEMNLEIYFVAVDEAVKQPFID